MWVVFLNGLTVYLFSGHVHCRCVRSPITSALRHHTNLWLRLRGTAATRTLVPRTEAPPEFRERYSQATPENHCANAAARARCVSRTEAHPRFPRLNTVSPKTKIKWNRNLWIPQCLQVVVDFAQCTHGRRVCDLPNECTAPQWC